MSLVALAFLVFLAALGITLSALYFLVEAPASRKFMRTRLATTQELFLTPSGDPDVQLLQEEMLSEIPWLNRLLLRFSVFNRIQRFLGQADLTIRLDQFLFLCAGFALVGVIVALSVRYPAPGVLVVAGVTGSLPFAFVAYKRKVRFSRFEELFPDAIDLLARAVRAGHAFTSGFELIAKEMPQPIAGEFSTTYEQQNLGMPLREALDNLGHRMPLPDVQLFISALQIQRESGGNLAEILDKLSYVVRERFKILRQIRVHTAEARMSLYILTAIPPATALLLFFVNREYMMTLVEEPAGHMMIVAAIVLQIVGYLVMRKITELEV